MATPVETKVVLSGADVEVVSDAKHDFLSLTFKQGSVTVLIEMPAYTAEKLLEELRDEYKPQKRR